MNRIGGGTSTSDMRKGGFGERALIGIETGTSCAVIQDCRSNVEPRKYLLSECLHFIHDRILR